MKRLIRMLLKYAGYEVVPYPAADWARFRSIVREVFEDLSINCVLDVGANVGQYASQLRSFGYSGWILSFEPVEANFALLQRAASRDPKWRAFPWALGTVDGPAEINVMDATVFSSF